MDPLCFKQIQIHSINVIKNSSALHVLKRKFKSLKRKIKQTKKKQIYDLIIGDREAFGMHLKDKFTKCQVI